MIVVYSGGFSRSAAPALAVELVHHLLINVILDSVLVVGGWESYLAMPGLGFLYVLVSIGEVVLSPVLLVTLFADCRSSLIFDLPVEVLFWLGLGALGAVLIGHDWILMCQSPKVNSFGDRRSTS